MRVVHAVPSGLDSQLSARPGSTSVVPGFRSTRVSKICSMTRDDSPSETRIPSRATGSAAEPKKSVPPPPPQVVWTAQVPPVDSLSPPPHPAAMRAKNATSGTANLSNFPLTLLSFRSTAPKADGT